MQAGLWDILKVLAEPFTRGQIWLLIPLAFALLFIPAWNADVMTGASTAILWALRQVKGLVTQSCPTLCNLMDYSLPGSSVHGVLQARILECVAISFSRESSQPTDQTSLSCITCIGRWILYHWATWEAPYLVYNLYILLKLDCFYWQIW